MIKTHCLFRKCDIIKKQLEFERYENIKYKALNELKARREKNQELQYKNMLERFKQMGIGKTELFDIVGVGGMEL